MGRLHGTIVDGATGERIDAKVHVLTASGNFAHLSDAMLKVGPGTPFFFSDGEFEVSASRGRVDVLVERGTEYEPARVVVDLPASGSLDVEIADQTVVLPAGGQLVPRQHPHPLR